MINSIITVNVTLGFSPAVERIIDRIIDLVAGDLSADDIAALKASNAQGKATAAKADVADGKKPG